MAITQIPKVAEHVSVVALCPKCSSFVGNDISHGGHRTQDGYQQNCENCGFVYVVPYRVIDAEVARIKALP